MIYLCVCVLEVCRMKFLTSVTDTKLSFTGTNKRWVTMATYKQGVHYFVGIMSLAV